MELAGWRDRLRAKPFAFWLVAGGLAYLGLGLLALIATFFTSLFDPFLYFVGLIVALFLVFAYGCYIGKKWGFAGGIAVTIFTLLLISFSVAGSYANPAYPGAWLIESGFPVALLVLAFSILALRKWKAGVANQPNLASIHSNGGLVALAVVGFAVGSLIVGVAAAPLIVNLLAGSGEAADIRIVPNAQTAAEPFVPGNFTAVRDTSGRVTVTWFNGDSNDHTVTSDSGAFASPLLRAGARFSFTFTQAGIYPYHCEPHPNMKGTVVVT